jgi:large subunit ribosomal protein L4
MSPAKDLPEDGQEEAVLSGAPEDAGTDEVEATEAAKPEASLEDEASAETEQPETSVEDEVEVAGEDETEQPEASVEDEAEVDDEDEDEAAEEGAAPAKPARRRAAAKSADDEPKAKAKAKTPAKPKRMPAKAKFGLVDAELPDHIFDAKVNVPLIHQVVVAQQAAARQGTHAVKTRGDVRGGGRKPYRQKGTGRARQGSTRAPQFAGGGVVHGPVPRSYEQKTPKKMKAAALRGALSDRARHGLIQVVEGFVDGADPSTRDALAVLNVATGGSIDVRSVLVVVQSSDQVTWKSLRNATGVHLIDPGQLNTYDVLVSDQVIFTSAALDAFVARAGAGAGRSA